MQPDAIAAGVFGGGAFGNGVIVAERYVFCDGAMADESAVANCFVVEHWVMRLLLLRVRLWNVL